MLWVILWARCVSECGDTWALLTETLNCLISGKWDFGLFDLIAFCIWIFFNEYTQFVYIEIKPMQLTKQFITRFSVIKIKSSIHKKHTFSISMWCTWGCSVDWSYSYLHHALQRTSHTGYLESFILIEILQIWKIDWVEKYIFNYKNDEWGLTIRGLPASIVSIIRP